MFNILTVLPGKKKLTSSGWTSHNAVCCSHRGHKADRRMRGGVKFDGPNNWSVHCFNCGFACKFTLGQSISGNTRKLLEWCGVDADQIQRWNIESLQNKDLLDFTVKQRKTRIKFKEVAMPEGQLLDPENPGHAKYIDYLTSRKLSYDEYPFLVTPDAKHRQKNRIIVPYTYKNKIVGSTSRYLDGNLPKYINDHQPGYVFGIDLQRPEWQVCILVEGIFDALSLNCCAYMHDTINKDQLLVLSQLNKQIIVVPDQDQTGLQVCDLALELGFSVALPNWGPGVKDVNDAVVKYGKLATLLSILQSATMSKIKIQLRKNQIDKL